jgi:regulatory protein
MDAYFDQLTRFCLYRERCTAEVIQKMYGLKISEERHPQLIQQLKEEKYLDDDRFLKAYINTKIYVKKWGKKKIQAELSLKKLDKTLIQKYFLEVDDEVYIDNLNYLAEKKWSTLHKKMDREKQASLFRYMAGKGYESDLVMDWLKANKQNLLNNKG